MPDQLIERSYDRVVTVPDHHRASLMSDEQVAELLGVSRGTVRRWRYDGDLPYVRLGRNLVRISRDDVDELVASRRVT
jgi:excisionase family DNA binding protein